MDRKIAAELMKLFNMRIIDLVTYKQEVDTKKMRTKLMKNLQTKSYKDECRKVKRRLCAANKSNNGLRKKIKLVVKRVAELEADNNASNNSGFFLVLVSLLTLLSTTPPR